MTRRVHALVAVAAVVSAIGAPAAAQQGGRGNQLPPATDRLAPPKAAPVGAWWHTGGRLERQAGVPDLTGVWFGGASGDLSRAALSGAELMLTPYGKQRWDTVDHAKDPNTACLPPGPARMIMMAHPAMIVQRSDVVVILTESQRTFRIIYTDGRGHPHDIVDYPEWMGSSIGTWEGETLVVDTSVPSACRAMTRCQRRQCGQCSSSPSESGAAVVTCQIPIPNRIQPLHRSPRYIIQRPRAGATSLATLITMASGESGDSNPARISFPEFIRTVTSSVAHPATRRAIRTRSPRRSPFA